MLFFHIIFASTIEGNFYLNANEKLMSHKYLTISNAGEGKQVIKLTGYISEWNNSSAEITHALDVLIADPGCTCIELVMMNFYGGDVFQGFPIRNKIKASPKPIEAVAEGIVASMATPLFTACKVRTIATGSRLVLHKPSANMYAQAHKLREAADTLDTVEQDLAKVYSEDIGMSVEDVIKKFLQPDKDYYMTAEEATKYGFATAKIDSSFIKSPIEENVILNSDLKAVASYYNQQFTNSINQNNDMKNLAAFVAILAMTGEATEESVLAKVTAMKNDLDEALKKVERLEKDQKEAREKAVKTLVEAAIKDGKITEAQRSTFEGLAEKDLEGVTKVLADMKPRQSLSATIGATGQPSGEVDPTAGMTFLDIRKKDPSGKMFEALMKRDPERAKRVKANPSTVVA